jgi:predicted RNase H-like nuclease (RuvC/YqgF family)
MFKDKRKKENEDDQKKIAQLERKVGQYAMEVDWLQKKINQLPFL